ncbi:hypothetical protein TcCL_NonESM10308 [Trypanosoma cruzi]|uniref:Uncharacterized protein n=1 Tax=Trypanosoma cruzi (strain CL Brener) TaxID=353153 RepID=Q4CS10_TRYCC|nr:hypothetical protein Tc00.1047053410923.30 [Trypanosoma cruzi]EAN83063.1 hypothetical protein Tc00.1047053410923.30 [Trypanosoma cruzi]RNC40241.1 hypothetical protein TcCL_NonESM10308 [Trypanosoma cruzi]|eukprot:XP_804914.1 hypothetical protein [Trypanosoma cruzi strain CL Brener]
MKKKDASRVRRGSHPLWKCCTACGGIALKCRTITHEDVARSGRLLLCFVSAAVGVGAAASDLSARWPQRVSVALFSREICCHAFTCVASGTMCRWLCDCRMEGEERKKVRECRGQESRWVSPRRALPTQRSTAPVGYSMSLRSIVFDAGSTQRGSGCRHRHECDRKGTCLLLCFEGSHRMAQWRAQSLIAESAHDTGHWPRSVCVVEDTAVESLLPAGGRTPEFLLFPTQADGCAMTTK